MYGTQHKAWHTAGSHLSTTAWLSYCGRGRLCPKGVGSGACAAKAVTKEAGDNSLIFSGSLPWTWNGETCSYQVPSCQPVADI